MKPTIATCLVSSALQMALLQRKPAKGLLHHSDRGSQYASHEYQKLLGLSQADCSMSRKGNCYDNAVVESFFKTLRTEELSRRCYYSYADAHMRISIYLDVYNTERLHSRLGYQPPVEFEERYAAARR